MTRPQRRGYTVKELIAAIVIIGLLAGLALMGLQTSREPSRRANCLNNLSQISAGGIYFATHREYLPPSRSWTSKSLSANGTFPADFTGDPERCAYTWVQPLLSYLDRPDMAEELANAPQDAQPLYGGRYNLLMCPSEAHDSDGAAALDYAINAGRINCDGQWQNHDWKSNGGSHDALRQLQDMLDYRRNRVTDRDLVDGAAHTIAFAENVHLRTWCLDSTIKPPVTAITEFHSGIIWDPNVSTFPKLPRIDNRNSKGVGLGSNYAHPSSKHSGGFTLAMWDSSSRFVSNSIDYTVYARLMSSDGRQTQDPCAAVFDGPTPAWQAEEVPDDW